jgi:FdhE protein
VRQGEVGPKGAWTGGNPMAGVKAPVALILPDPASLFSRRAVRLEALATGHPMQDWLHFMARLAQAQHVVATNMAGTNLGPVDGDASGGPDEAAVTRSVAARMPPLAADGHRRNSAWLDGLAMLLDEADVATNPAPARAAIARLRQHDDAAIERWADRFLMGGVDRDDAGPVLYVAAALQVYFALQAARLPAATLRLLPQRGLCPCCGSTPVSGVVTAAGSNPGTRYLHCSLCATAWTHVRAVCVSCGEARSLSQRGIEGDSGAVKAETCDLCQTYAKMLYQARDMQVDPFADDLASLGLDILVTEAGWSRHAANPLLLSG